MPAWSAHRRGGGHGGNGWGPAASGHSHDWKKDPSGRWQCVGAPPPPWTHESKANRAWTCKGCAGTNHTRNACSTWDLGHETDIFGGGVHDQLHASCRQRPSNVGQSGGKAVGRGRGGTRGGLSDAAAANISARCDPSSACGSAASRGDAPDIGTSAHAVRTLGSWRPGPEMTMAALGEQLTAAVQQARSFASVDPSAGEEAQRESETLLARSQATLQAAQAATQAAKANMRRRLNGKQPAQPPVEPPIPLDRRPHKKQKVQTHLDAWFTLK
ncbi:unnamed protein product, partial [Prorocentrum cordatum]